MLPAGPIEKTVGEQFHMYPKQNHEAGVLSLLLKDTYDHCGKVFKSQFGL